MTRWLWIACALLLGTLAQASLAAADAAKTLYERVAEEMRSRPELAALGKPPPELAKVAWMLGEWDIEAKVAATAESSERVDRGSSSVTSALGGTWLQFTDTYPEGNQDLSFLTYNIATRRWTSVTVDAVGNNVAATAAAWDGDRLALMARDVEVLGLKVTLRQTIVKRSDDEFALLNEELLPDGRWQEVDEYRYRRKVAGAQ